MENLIISLGCVTPMFLTLCVGLLARRFHIIPGEAVRHLSTLAFRALLPCLLFQNIYQADLRTSIHPLLAVYLPVFTLLWFAVSCVYYSRRQPDLRRRGTQIQNAFRSNIAVVGMSLARSMMGDEGGALVAVTIGTVVPIYNVLAVTTLETCRSGKVSAGKTIRNILTNPLIIGCLAGLLLSVLGIRLPEPVMTAITGLGNAGSTLTLIALGASFEFDRVGPNLPVLIRCLAVRLVLCPLVALGAALLLGMRGNDLGVVLVCTGSPTASTSYPMAIAMDSDYELAGQIVVASSLLCCFTLFVWIFLLKQTALL